MSAINIYGGAVILNLRFRHNLLQETSVLREHHLPVWRAGELDAVVVDVVSLEEASWVVSEAARSDGEMVIVRSRKELEGRPPGSMGLFLSFEGWGPAAGDLDLLYLLPRIGFTTFTFSHNRQNLYCTGCNEEYEGSFTHLGREALGVLESLPLLVDLVHMSRSSFWQALDVYSGLVIVSHSNADAVWSSPRSLTDDQIRAVGERKGVVGINFYRGLLAKDPAAATLNDLLDHFMHVYDLIGPEHTAIGADFAEAPSDLVEPLLRAADPEGKFGLSMELYQRGPEGFEDAGRLGHLPSALRSRGLRDDEIALIMGDSYLRALDLVQESMAPLGTTG